MGKDLLAKQVLSLLLHNQRRDGLYDHLHPICPTGYGQGAAFPMRTEPI